MTTSAGKRSIDSLVAAIGQSPAQDAFNCRLTALQWDTLSDYSQALAVPERQALIERGAPDRTARLVESSSLSNHYQDNQGRVCMAIVLAGSVVGESGFFSHVPRSATVQASGPAKLWLLFPLRFLDLANRHSTIALEFILGLGSVIARRLYN